MFMFLGITPRLARGLRGALYAVVVYVVCAFLASIFMLMAWCRPFKTQWTLTPTGFCSPLINPVFIGAYGALDLTSSVLVMGTPLAITRLIKAPPYDLWAIAFLVFLGSLTVLINVAICAIDILTVKTTAREDITYDSTQMPQILSQAELAAALIAVSLPSIRAYAYHRREKRNPLVRTAHLGESGTAIVYEGPMEVKRNATVRTFTEDEDQFRLIGRSGILRRVSFEVTSQPADYPMHGLSTTSSRNQDRHDT